MSLQYKPVFKFDPEDASYKIMGPTSEQIRHDLLMAFHRDVEGKIRQALIDMGWTPPPETSSVTIFHVSQIDPPARTE